VVLTFQVPKFKAFILLVCLTIVSQESGSNIASLILPISISTAALILVIIVAVFAILRIRRKKLEDNEKDVQSGDINLSTVSSFTKKFDKTRRTRIKLIMKLDSGGFGEVCMAISKA
jgi:hypothetical protein